MDYRNGDSYEGQWVAGRKRGLGTHYCAVSRAANYVPEDMSRIRGLNSSLCPFLMQALRFLHALQNGDFFVGYFMQDKREGLGTLYMVAKVGVKQC